MNDDGKLDLVTLSYETGEVVWYENREGELSSPPDMSGFMKDCTATKCSGDASFCYKSLEDIEINNYCTVPACQMSDPTTCPHGTECAEITDLGGKYKTACLAKVVVEEPADEDVFPDDEGHDFSCAEKSCTDDKECTCYNAKCTGMGAKKCYIMDCDAADPTTCPAGKTCKSMGNTKICM